MEISNKFLAFLLVFAIVVSIGGALYNTSRLNKFFITGYGSRGFVNVTISNLTSVNVIATDCSFGSGYINATLPSALLESNGTITNWSGAGTTNSITIRNDGNTNITLNLSSGATLAEFYGIDCSGNGCQYKFWSANNETGGCASGLVAYSSAVSLGTDNKTVCSIMRYEDTNDSVNVYCKLLLTTDIPTGAKTDTWTFLASAA